MHGAPSICFPENRARPRIIGRGGDRQCTAEKIGRLQLPVGLHGGGQEGRPREPSPDHSTGNSQADCGEGQWHRGQAAPDRDCHQRQTRRTPAQQTQPGTFDSAQQNESAANAPSKVPVAARVWDHHSNYRQTRPEQVVLCKNATLIPHVVALPEPGFFPPSGPGAGPHRETPGRAAA